MAHAAYVFTRTRACTAVISLVTVFSGRMLV